MAVLVFMVSVRREGARMTGARARGSRATFCECVHMAEEVRKERFQRGKVGCDDADVHLDSARLASARGSFRGSRRGWKKDLLLPDVVPRPMPAPVCFFEEVGLHRRLVDGDCGCKEAKAKDHSKPDTRLLVDLEFPDHGDWN